MSSLRYLEDIPIDIPNTLRQLLSRFQTVKDGLPELIKNAKDQYARVAVTSRDARQIVVIVDSKKESIAVLDFAGAQQDDIRRWKTWSDPAANLAERSHDIEGGHGNGGKAFMVRGSIADSFLHSCTKGKRTKIGFDNSDPGKQFLPGFYIEAREPVDNVVARDAQPALESSLRSLSVKYNNLPRPVQKAFEKRKSFTIAQVNGIKDWDRKRDETKRRLVNEIPDQLRQHAQAALSLETCAVWVVIDGKVVGSGPLEAIHPEPMPGFETLPPIPVPQTLTDPQTQETIDTGSGDVSSKFLQLRTSRRSLRMEDSRPLNVIRVRNDRNIVDSWSVADLQSGAESAFIFGELHVPAFSGDQIVGADRASGLADTPLFRAIRRWTTRQVEALAEQIQRASAKEHKAEDRNKANDGLKKLRDLMREFLELAAPGLQGAAPGSKGSGQEGSDPKPPKVPEYGTVVHEVVLEAGNPSVAIAEGTAIPLIVKPYEITANGERKPVPYADLQFMTANPEVVEFTTERLLRGVKQGRATIWFRAQGVESNHAEVEVVTCSGAEIQNVPDRLLMQGERVSLRVVFETADGSRSDLLVEGGVDELDRGRISRNGVFTAGGQEGDATVRVRYGKEPQESTTQVLRIGPERLQTRGQGGKEGGELPFILLCGTPAPNMEQYPPAQRTVPASEHVPTIIDYEPQFEHVIFLNPDSKEAVQVRRGKGGRRGTLSIGTETFLQFLALKCFEILKRLHVKQSVKDGVMTEQQFREYFAHAEMECATFVERAYAMARELATAESELVA